MFYPFGLCLAFEYPKLIPNKVDEIYSDYFPEYKLTKKFLESSVKLFLKKLDCFQVEEAMITACDRVDDADESIRYFCGVCWTKIRNNGKEVY